MDAAQAREIVDLAQSACGVVLDALADAVTIRGADDRLLYANRAALDRMGLASVEEIVATDPRELIPRRSRRYPGSRLS